VSARDLLDTVWIVPLLPAVGAVVLGLFGRRIGDPRAGWLATGFVALAFAWSLVMVGALLSLPDDARSNVVNLWTWIPVGVFRVHFGFLADPLSVTWILVVTGVGSLIHLYAIGYMRGDENYGRFFAFFNLFVFAMLLLVLASNFLLTFVGWEGVALCSYLLIGFWYQRRRASSASVKAFVTNRVGDIGFLVAMFFTFEAIGSLDYSALSAQAGALAHTTATAISLLIFLACIGKSAQIGLHVWLTDAMEGPTPVSALIHAATMVTAGVYLTCRTFPVFQASGDAMTVVAAFGAATALWAGTVAIVQPDIKRILAYSTISQLGYMFLAVGVGAYVAAVFFVICHACYKATLFLGAGTVIHGSDDEQDVRDLGGLRRFMPVTSLAFVAAWLAIAGIPPFSGFWAKDDVLAGAFFGESYAVYAIALLAVVLTALYMTRETMLVFFGNERFRTSTAEEGAAETYLAAARGEVQAERREELVLAHQHAVTASATVDFGDEPAPLHLEHDPHEGSRVMLISIGVLAVLSVVVGFIELPFTKLEFLGDWLDPVFAGVSQPHPTSFLGGLGLSLLAIVVAVAGISYAWVLYHRGLEHRAVDPLEQRLGPIGRFFGHAWYYDEGITALVGGPLRRAASWLADVFDMKIIDGAVNGVAWLFREAAGGLRKVQTGLVRQYALGIALGSVLLLLWVLARAGVS